MRGSLEAVAIARDVASTSPSKGPSALDMMRCQRVSADCLRAPNGTAGGSRKLASRSCKDDGALVIGTDSSRLASSPLEPKRARAPQPPPPPPSAAGPSQPHDQGHHPSDSSDTTSPSSTGAAGSGGGVGDVLLQWGHKKRSRGRRDAAGAAPAPQRRQAGAKIQRRSSAPTEKLMPPPPAAASGSYTRGSNLRGTSSLPARGGGGGGDGLHGRHAPQPHRSVEEKSGGQSRAEKRSPEKANKSTAEAADMNQDSKNQQYHGVSGTGNGAPAADEKVELPRVFVGLSRKEKEDDFMAMKGTKLPQRPKKRAKNVDKNLQYVFPGMWLSDLTKSRYEVREKKCVKKKRRGLKGMESMDSDSD